MSTEKVLQTLHEYHDAWGRGDRERGTAFYAEDLVVHMGGEGPVSGDHQGRDSFLRDWMDRVSEYTDSWTTHDHEVILAGEEGVTATVTVRWTRGEREVVARRICVYGLQGEQIAECWFADLNSAAVDEFFDELDSAL